jgi:hypothetical protein
MCAMRENHHSAQAYQQLFDFGTGVKTGIAVNPA